MYPGSDSLKCASSDILPDSKLNKDVVAAYYAHIIENFEDLRLTRGGLVLFALLLGGDYANRVDHCGPVAARGLAQCGFGDRLLAATQTMSAKPLEEFLTAWRDELRNELLMDSQKIIGRRYPAAAHSIPDDFPNLTVLQNYMHPLTSWSTGPPSPLPPSPASHEPNIHKIAKFAVDRLR